MILVTSATPSVPPTALHLANVHISNIFLHLCWIPVECSLTLQRSISLYCESKSNAGKEHNHGMVHCEIGRVVSKGKLIKISKGTTQGKIQPDVIDRNATHVPERIWGENVQFQFLNIWWKGESTSRSRCTGSECNGAREREYKERPLSCHRLAGPSNNLKACRRNQEFSFSAFLFAHWQPSTSISKDNCNSRLKVFFLL